MNYCKNNNIADCEKFNLSKSTINFLQEKDINNIQDLSNNIDMQLAALEKEIIIKYLLADFSPQIKKELWSLSLDIKKTRELLRGL